MTLTITIDDLLSWDPCRDHDELRELAAGKERWSAMDILALDQPPEGLLWVVLRPELIPEPILHGLACDFAEHVLPIWEAKYPDDLRPRDAIACKRRWLRGEVGDEALAAAGAAAAWAAWAARAAEWAAWAAELREAERRWQADRVREVLETNDNGDKSNDTQGS